MFFSTLDGAILDGQPRLKGLVNDIPKCISDIDEYNVRNSAELVPCHFGEN